MKKEDYTKEVLLDVMGAYLRQIHRDKSNHPTVVLSDIEASIKAVLKKNDYNGKYKEDLQ